MGSRMRSAFAFRGKDGTDESKEEVGEDTQLEESMSDMMMAEANRQLRQLQADLLREREQVCVCECVCLCVCERERERVCVRERECVCVRV